MNTTSLTFPAEFDGSVLVMRHLHEKATGTLCPKSIGNLVAALPTLVNYVDQREVFIYHSIAERAGLTAKLLSVKLASSVSVKLCTHLIPLGDEWNFQNSHISPLLVNDGRVIIFVTHLHSMQYLFGAGKKFIFPNGVIVGGPEVVIGGDGK